MKVTIDHAKEFVKQYELASGVTLSEKDVLFCLDYVFAETVPAKDIPAIPELTEESIRKMIEEYASKPIEEYASKPIVQWPSFGVYAYMAPFPGSRYPNQSSSTMFYDQNKTDKE